MSSDAAVSRLQSLLRVPTVSRIDEGLTDWEPFDRFIALLEELYPLVHRRLDREIFAGHSLLYRWAGRASTEPTVLLAHYDVVPATDTGWKHPPFAAELSGKGDEQLLWGRGTLDNKASLAAILESVESHLEDGTTPAQDVYLAFGHNEEAAGDGMIAIVDELERRGVRPSLVLDEGGAIAEDVFPGVGSPVAMVGVGEKGVSNLTLVVDEKGGHASTPPPLTATARLARAILRLNSTPFPARFTPIAIEMFRIIGLHASGFPGAVYRRIGLTERILLGLIPRQSAELNAMVRTTQAVTMLAAGQAENALAERATANVNVRIAMGDTVETAVAHVRKAIDDDGVRVEIAHAGEPSPISPLTGLPWELLRSTIVKTYPGTVVAPYIQNGATDSRHFTRITRGVYRFVPFEMSREERDTLHAKNERIRVSTYLRGIDFYRALLASL
jgi:carboxypeptidase PM20D1